MTSSLPGSGPPLLVGRERELAVLRSHLAAALTGQGSLVLISGEAGIGKTSLAESLCREATEQGALVLVSRCYDLTETPPYGPWGDLFGTYTPGTGLPSLPAAFSQRGTVGAVESLAALFTAVQDFIAALTAHGPLLILLDDLHWADPASLDLLRSVARTVVRLPLLILVTYRADELTRRHPLYTLLPLLERESGATRLDLRRLTPAAIRALVDARYALASTDADRLTAYLMQRAEGNAFFSLQLLRALEDEDALRPTEGGWVVGDIDRTRVPFVVRQVIDARLARLDEGSQRLLVIAAVIGHEVPLAVWTRVADVDDEVVLTAIEQGLRARLLVETPDGAAVQFTHALTREAIYEGEMATRRRALHRRVAEALELLPGCDPDAMAYHYQRAGDARAIPWLIKAGERAFEAHARATAVARFEEALARMEAAQVDLSEQGWQRQRLARALIFFDRRQTLAHLDAAYQMAQEAGDAALAAVSRHSHGHYLLHGGHVEQGLAELAEGVAALEALTEAEQERLRTRSGVLIRRMADARGTLIEHLAWTGRLAAACEVAAGFTEEAGMIEAGGGLVADGFDGLGILHALAGDPDAARAALASARATYRASGNEAMVAQVNIIELPLVALPYRADRVEEREQLEAEMESALVHFEQSGYGRLHAPRAYSAALRFVDGHWAQARACATAGVGVENAMHRQMSLAVLGVLARVQGEREVAWAQVRAFFAAGAATPPGTCRFPYGQAVQRLAAALALDRGDLPTAKAWLDAHDRWLEWSEAVLGQSEGQALWAQYHRAGSEPDVAYERAEEARAQATEPRQPLALLQAHRLLGELDTDSGRADAAARHLDAALRLAEACRAPYERAQTLLAMAALHVATGEVAVSRQLLDEVRTVGESLGAMLMLARADALAARLDAKTLPHAVSYPAGLSAREVDVLRLVATGLSNAEIAERLFVSVRTVETHIRGIYTKLGTSSRSVATRFAIEHDLA